VASLIKDDARRRPPLVEPLIEVLPMLCGRRTVIHGTSFHGIEIAMVGA
jgi:hypothetical protein